MLLRQQNNVRRRFFKINMFNSCLFWVQNVKASLWFVPTSGGVLDNAFWACDVY